MKIKQDTVAFIVANSILKKHVEAIFKQQIMAGDVIVVEMDIGRMVEAGKQIWLYCFHGCLNWLLFAIYGGIRSFLWLTASDSFPCDCADCYGRRKPCDAKAGRRCH